MEYTVQKLGRMAGVSTRTLRYYDEIGILKPVSRSKGMVLLFHFAYM